MLPFQPTAPLSLAGIWTFGGVAPAGAPGILEMSRFQGLLGPFFSFLIFFLELFIMDDFRNISQ